jgi:hypothetical protein
LIKIGLGYILGGFFTNASGHPDRRYSVSCESLGNWDKLRNYVFGVRFVFIPTVFSGYGSLANNTPYFL